MQERRHSIEQLEHAGSADGKASSQDSAQKNLSDSGLITLGKRLAPKNPSTGAMKIPSKRQKRASDDMIFTEPIKQLESNITASNQVEEVKQTDDQQSQQPANANLLNRQTEKNATR